MVNTTTNYSAWLDQFLLNLERSGHQGQETQRFLTERHIRLGFHDQPTAARWTITSQIQLHPRYAAEPPDSPYPQSLIVHEVRHLQQGWITALSVRGELEAWQLQFAFLKSLTGRYHELTYRDLIIRELMSYSPNGDRRGLSQVRDLMRAYAGKAYRIDLLPLYPLPEEIRFLISGSQLLGK